MEGNTARTVVLTALLMAPASPVRADIVAWDFTATEGASGYCRIDVHASNHGGADCLLSELWGAERRDEGGVCLIEDDPDWTQTEDGCHVDDVGINHCWCDAYATIPLGCEILDFEFLCGDGICGWFDNNLSLDLGTANACLAVNEVDLYAAPFPQGGNLAPGEDADLQDTVNCAISRVGGAGRILVPLMTLLFVASLMVARRRK